jgi:hypothetical protein
MLFRRNPFKAAGYQRDAAAIIESLAMLRALAGNYAVDNGPVPAHPSRSFQHRADVDNYPVLVTMQDGFAWIDFMGGWTPQQVRLMYAALVPLLPPAYNQAMLSFESRIGLRVSIGRHPIKRLNAALVEG